MKTEEKKIYKMTMLEMQELIRASEVDRPGEFAKKVAVERATEVWKHISIRVGCDYKTVEGCPGKGPRFFQGVPTIYI